MLGTLVAAKSGGVRSRLLLCTLVLELVRLLSQETHPAAAAETYIHACQLGVAIAQHFHPGMYFNIILVYVPVSGPHAVLSGAGLGLTQLAGSNGDKVMNKDKLKMATGVLALNSFFFAWRSVKRNSLL